MNSQKTIIFLHGWGLSSEVFKPLSYYMKDDFFVYAPDLPGFGKSPIEKPMTLKDYADFIYKFIRDNNIKEPIIVGHSFGGVAAIELAILYPESMSKLILVGATAIRKPNLKIKLLRKIAGILKYFFPKKTRKFILKLFQLDASDYALIAKPHLKETFKNIINENLAPELQLIKIPVLVIWGEKDAVTPLSEGKLIAETIPDAKLVVVKNAGHFLFLEKPDEFITLIKEFASS